MDGRTEGKPIVP